MSQTKYHDPVMLKESTEALNIDPSGIYVDVTYGGGGHSKEILSKLDKGKVYAFDQDPDAQTQKDDSDKLIFINQNFRYLSNYLRMYKAIPVNGLLADLGISSHQINVEGRGFAFRMDGPLDMRMDQQGDLTAEKILNEYDERQLKQLFWEYGEIKNSAKLARRICETREEEKISTTAQFVALIEHLVPARIKNRFLAQVFQALRIEVNQEMEALKELLMQLEDSIQSEGIIAFITYHSLEDRLVKNYIKSGNLKGEIKKGFLRQRDQAIRSSKPQANPAIGRGNI